jgi:hypothetical protein
MGRHQLRLLRFALDYPSQWHTYGKDKSTTSAVYALASLELIELSKETRQFRLRRPRHFVIRTRNEAFENHVASEIARILRALADRLEQEGVQEDIKLFDSNGNAVGSFSVQSGMSNV